MGALYSLYSLRMFSSSDELLDPHAPSLGEAALAGEPLNRERGVVPMAASEVWFQCPEGIARVPGEADRRCRGVPAMAERIVKGVVPLLAPLPPFAFCPTGDFPFIAPPFTTGLLVTSSFVGGFFFRGGFLEEPPSSSAEVSCADAEGPERDDNSTW